MNHLSDFGSPGGVQTYLCSLAKDNINSIKLYSYTKPLKIYTLKNTIKIRIKRLGIFSIINLLSDFNIIHNLILSKKWIPYILFHKLFRKKVIYHEHGAAWHNPDKNKSIYKKRIKDVDTIIVNSNATKKLLENIYQINQKINVLRSPIFLFEENQKFGGSFLEQKYGSNFKENEFITIGFMGRLEKHKNPKFLIKLAKYLNEEFDILVKLEFIGKGPELSYLKNYAKQLKINADFFGLIENRRSIVKKWDFSIVPSIREPLGLVQGEIPIMDTLCLSSDIDGIPELYPADCDLLKIRMVKKKDFSLRFENYQYCPSLGIFDKGYEPDVKDCASKIAYLIDHPKDLNELLKKHKLFIKSEFNIKAHLKLLNKIIYK